ncbi:MAG TPA: DUF222 domain-containing protein [Streptosporangiaceae bacterium]
MVQILFFRTERGACARTRSATQATTARSLAHELHLTTQSAAAQMDYASTVTGRLPATCAALRAGAIHPVHARILEDETRVLSRI